MNAVDEYISRFPKDVQNKLQQIRKTVKKSAPKTEETISYGIPTFKFDGKNLVHFGGYKKHVSFYPTSSGVEVFKRQLSDYKTSKGTIQFSLDKKIPYELISKIVKFRVKEMEFNKK